MTRVSKLKELGLEKKAYELRKSGETWESVANIINGQHGKEIISKYDSPLTHMAIKRGIVAYEKDLVEKALDEDNPLEEVSELMKKAIFAANKKNRKLEKKADTILDNAMKDGSYSDQTRALKEVRDTMSQEVKNMTTLMQYCDRQFGNARDINIKEQKNVIIMLKNYADELFKIYENLCPECKKKLDIERLLSQLH